MNRQHNIARLQTTKTFDVCIIGGGATGLGLALDAASRGHQTLLLEKFDFAKGTSSRSTKLIHGGVRYLRQGNVKLVWQALQERGRLMKNAPHLVNRQAFVIPVYSVWEKWYYGFGLKLYDWLSGSLSLGDTQILSVSETLEKLPGIHPDGLKGGVLYYDAQFDDARLAIHLGLTAEKYGATLLNYFCVDGLLHDTNGRINGVTATDTETQMPYHIFSRVVINATGVFSQSITALDPSSTKVTISPSQGIHLVLDKEFLPGDHALMVPKTKDGRVLFAVPWLGKIIVGTTDTPVSGISEEPLALQEEIDFVMEHAALYLAKRPTYADIQSIYAGLRPLVKSSNKITSALSRDHQISCSPAGLISITGGKWTTYRKMAEDAMQSIYKNSTLPKESCRSANLAIYQYTQVSDSTSGLIHSAFAYTVDDIKRAVENEMCRTLEDALCRRTRMLFLNAQAAMEAAPTVVKIISQSLQKDEQWENQQLVAFKALAKRYLISF